MSNMTLILTRFPLQEFFYVGDTNEDLDGMEPEDIERLYRKPGTKQNQPHDVTHYSGRWGSLLMIVGPKISSATFVAPPVPGTPVTVRLPTDTTQIVSLADRDLKLVTDGRVIESQSNYTTIERFRGDTGYLNNAPNPAESGYVELHPEAAAPYLLSLGTGYSKLIEMRAATHGDYVKINGTSSQVKRMSEQEQAILIHEAVHVGWLVGCISPRPLGDTRVFDRTDANNPSAICMREIFAALRAAPNQNGSMYVLDW